jgi:hypothetical protein
MRSFAHCKDSERLDHVLSRGSLADFDNIPVEDDGKIVGMIYRTPSPNPVPVRSTFRPLSADYLIGERASASKFIERAEVERSCIVVGADGITGMVTVSDLQELPVQVALFGLAAQLNNS